MLSVGLYWVEEAICLRRAIPANMPYRTVPIL